MPGFLDYKSPVYQLYHGIVYTLNVLNAFDM